MGEPTSQPLPQFDVNQIPEPAHVTRGLVQALNDAVDVNDALVAIVQAFLNIEGTTAGIEAGLEEWAERFGRE